ncbi:SURF1 family protein [Sphingomicrobium astaxanthinifaciens]|uniref:SURF1 family protein n=1 Tax=Sphingomicrobium astaxanthinifaciens TaxID=1227949 RepID=UPI001FCC82F0|nr:SURF1 family protein [Sphingomicrobium astaxanthinifaciens]MCJ7421027.1 SURF1 family protein [Sphingomicrobium astaxanthinifaciens]
MTRTRIVLGAIVTAIAVAIMIGLGFWQLDRLEEKRALIAGYAQAVDQPPIAYPPVPTADPPLYRRSALTCLEVTGWRHQAGANAAGQPGYVHVADCRLGAEGPGAAVEIGWSREPTAGTDWQGGPVEGVIGPDERYRYRLVADEGLAGLERSAPPSLAAIRNNHLAYAVQWFAFAAIALVIFALATRKRRREGA